ncbi:hypothetical protein HOLleu_10096 [Holothuria leucospilota]|uniref:G-protein coupled receptors family 1 profile domain-containing protein n=1 Tax=Holothuria leucospilota TaxID=206669 RepID=A0A9Q1CEA2_HOLLE|nr:hypothetical protein HOLleu_10096 [Holothuria leucospilota]
MNSTGITISLDDFRLIGDTPRPNDRESSNSDGGLLSGWDDAEILYIIRLFEIRLGICCLAFVINVIVVTLQFKIKSHARTQYIFALTLTIADIIHSIAVFGETYLFRKNIFPLPIWYGAMVFASGLQSYLSILAVACDRYLALCAIPFKYKQVVTVRKYWVIFVVMFIICLITGFIAFGTVSHKNVSIAFTSFVFPTALITLICFVYIRLAYLISKSLLAMKLSDDMRRRRAVKTRRIIIAFTTILAANVFCNMPQRFFGLYISLQPPEKRYNLVENIILTNWLYNVQTFNTCLNPLILWHQVLVKEIQMSSISSLCRVVCPMQRSLDPHKSQSNDDHSNGKSVSVVTRSSSRLSQDIPTGIFS